MTKTLTMLLNETLAKLHLEPFVSTVEAPYASFMTSIVVALPDGNQLDAAGIGLCKKTAHHIASGKLLLKILENDLAWFLLKQFEYFTEQQEAVNFVHESLLAVDNTTTLIKKNPIADLITVCHYAHLDEPKFIPANNELANPNGGFRYICKVGFYEEVGEALRKREARSRAAHAMLMLFMKFIRRGRPAGYDDNDYDMEKLKKVYLEGKFVGPHV